MKVKVLKLSALCSLLLLAFSLASCSLEKAFGGDAYSGGSANVGKITLVVAEEPAKEYTVDLSKLEITQGLMSVLEYLRDEEGLNLKISGTMLGEVGSLKNNAEAGEYIYIYTSVASDADVTENASAVEYNGQTLTSSGVGAADMTLSDGAVIYIGIIKW